MCVVVTAKFKHQTHGGKTMADNAKPKINVEAAYENAHGVVQTW